MMLSLPRTQTANPFKGLLFSVATYGSHGFLFPPPGDSRATSVSTARGLVHRTLGLLKPHLCKLSTFSQRNETDTSRAVAQPQQAGTLRRLHPTLRLVDHVNYGGMLRDTRRISPAYCSDQRLSPAGQSTLFKRGGVCQ